MEKPHQNLAAELTIPICKNCDSRLRPDRKGDFFGYCSWDCLNAVKTIFEQTPQAETPFTGTDARPMNLDWVQSIIDQCQTAAVPVFVKQLGTKPLQQFNEDGETVRLWLKDRKGGNINEWPEELRIREINV